MSRGIVSPSSFRASGAGAAAPIVPPFGAPPASAARPAPTRSDRDPAAARLQEACDQIETQVVAVETRVARAADGRTLRTDVTQLSDSLRRLRNMLTPFQVRPRCSNANYAPPLFTNLFAMLCT